jgi:hypothetical protein
MPATSTARRRQALSKADIRLSSSNFKVCSFFFAAIPEHFSEAASHSHKQSTAIQQRRLSHELQPLQNMIFLARCRSTRSIRSSVTLAARTLSIRSSLKIQGVIFDFQLIAQQTSQAHEGACSTAGGGDLQQADASAAHKQAPAPEQTAVGSVMQMMQLIKQRNMSSVGAEIGSLSELSGAQKREQQQQSAQPLPAAATAPKAAVDTNDVRIKYLRKLQERTGGRTSAGAGSRGDSDLLAAARVRTDIAGN